MAIPVIIGVIADIVSILSFMLTVWRIAADVKDGPEKTDDVSVEKLRR